MKYSYTQKLEMFSKHSALAYKIAHKHWACIYVSREDVEQEALLTLWDCIEKYDEGAATNFGAYAYKYIFYSLSSFALGYKYGNVGIGVNGTLALRLINKSINENIPIDDVCAIEGITSVQQDIVHAIWANHQENALLHDLVDVNDKQYQLVDLIADEYDGIHEVEDKMMNEFYYRLLHTDFVNFCRKRSRNANVSRYYLLLNEFIDIILGDSTKTQVTISKEYNMTRAAVSKQFIKFKQYLKDFIHMSGCIA